MFKAFKEHCERPITWVSIIKLCGVSMLASIVISAVTMYRFGKSLNEVHESYSSEEDEAE